jgi:hypothetical protein
LIASESFSKCHVADQAEADRRDSRPYESAGQALQHQRGKHDRNLGPKTDHKRTQRNDACAQRDEQALRAAGVEQPAPGKLTQ